MMQGVRENCCTKVCEAPISKGVLLFGVIMFIITAIVAKQLAVAIGERRVALIKYFGETKEGSDYWGKQFDAHLNRSNSLLTSTIILGSVTVAALIAGVVLLARQSKPKNFKEEGASLALMYLLFFAIIAFWVAFGIEYQKTVSMSKSFNVRDFHWLDREYHTSRVANDVYADAQMLYGVGLGGTLSAIIVLSLILFAACKRRPPTPSQEPTLSINGDLHVRQS